MRLRLHGAYAREDDTVGTGYMGCLRHGWRVAGQPVRSHTVKYLLDGRGSGNSSEEVIGVFLVAFRVLAGAVCRVGP